TLSYLDISKHSKIRRGGSKYHYFFFQAEDGIRDGHVTGVQTCALPIYLRTICSSYGRRTPPSAGLIEAVQTEMRDLASVADKLEIGRASLGKECRSRLSP